MIKMWEEFSSEIDKSYIKDIFLDIVDEWDMFDIIDEDQLARGQDTKIEYAYLDLYGSYRYTFFNHVDDILTYNGKIVDDNMIGIYINLAGANDFFRIRNEFLDDLDKIVNRINTIYNCTLLKHPHNSNKFIVFIN